MKITLTYGKKNICLEIPEKNIVDFIKPKTPIITSRIGKILADALNNSQEKLENICENKRIIILLEDSTRSVPHKEIIKELTKKLTKASYLHYIIATGSHEPIVSANLEIIKYIEKYTQEYNISKFNTTIHDCENHSYEFIDKTSYGTEIYVNSKILNGDLFLVSSTLGNHYFAGYTNPYKNFLPGICKFETIEKNHHLSLRDGADFGIHPLHPDDNRKNNPVSCDMKEAVSLIAKGKPIFVLGSIGDHKNIYWAKFGKIEDVTTEGIKKVDELTTFKVQPCSYVIVSPGGYPKDASIYFAHRGLDLVNQGIKDNGEVLLLAECSEGLAPSKLLEDYFYHTLTLPIDDIFDHIRKNYKLSQQKTYKFAQLIKRTKKIWLYSLLSYKQIEDIHLAKCEDPQLIIDKWIEKDKDAKILIFDYANSLAIHSI